MKSFIYLGKRNEKNDEHLADCDYFTADKIEIDGEYKGYVDNDSFLSIIVIDGKGIIKDGVAYLQRLNP